MNDYALIFLFAVAFAPSSPAHDWPQWRGPNRDGISAETNLLSQWPPAGPPLAWKARGLAHGYSSLAVVGSRIFTVGDQGDSSFLLAFNADNGKLAWSAKLSRGGAPGWGNFEGPRGTPTVDGDLVFVLGQWGDLACFEAASGKERWRKNSTKDFGGQRPEWGFAESPLVDGEQVVFTPGGSQGAVVALNKTTGAERWRSKQFTDLSQYASLIPAEIGRARQYLQLTEASVAGIAAADGKLLWRAPRKGSTAVIPTPIYWDSMVYVTSGYSIGCNLFKVAEINGKFSAEQAYANKVMVNHHGGVVRVGNYIYGHSDNGGWLCQEALTGKARWSEKRKIGKGSIVYADGHLYLRAESGTVALIDASPDGFNERGRFEQPERTDKNAWAHPVIADGKLYLRDQDLLLCYDLRPK